MFEVERVDVGFGNGTVVHGVSTSIAAGSFTAIVGPNGCGKSTLLRALARVVRPQRGQVLLDGTPIQAIRPREMARKVSLLPQFAIAPDGIRVVDLVARGRSPHQSLVHQWRASDEGAVERALAATSLSALAHREVAELSGGQRQRVWIAMMLAQEAPVMLLDEPTSFLDIAHQYELLDLLRTLHKTGTTVVTVLHDLGQAARYADSMIVMDDGRIVAEGEPHHVLNADLINDVFGIRTLVLPDPVTGTPAVYPIPALMNQ